MRVLFLAVGFVYCLANAVPKASSKEASENIPPRIFAVVPAKSEIKIDGQLDELAWKGSTIIDLPYEWFPGENTEAPVRTECFVTYDETNLYVGFLAHDPRPEEIRAHLIDRDQIDTFIQDDYVGFMIDTFQDQRRAYQFRINPMGVQAEAFYTALEEDWGWDMIWHSAARITDNGYTVEVALPFHQLRFPRKDGGLTFGFGAMRSWPRNLRHRMQSFRLDYGNTCLICQFNQISGFEGLSSGYGLELDPTLTANRTDRRTRQEEVLEKGKIDVDPGLSVRWGITPNLTANGTINPDFSQVEADVAQLEVNERFALFFPEKRPFFLEGSDFFQTPQRAAFTRTVADPLWGAKLTGKIQGNALGLFVTRDRINNLIIPFNQYSALDSVDQEVTGSVVRYRRDVGRSSSLGALYTGREATDYHNRVAGLDGLLQIADADTLAFQYLHSDTLYPDEISRRYGQCLSSFGGGALQAVYTHNTREWAWSAGYEDLSPGFRADSGFIPRVDVRRGLVWVSRTWWADAGDWWTSLRLGPGYERIHDHQGRLANQSIGLEGEFQGPLQSKLLFTAFAKKEFFNGETFDLNQTSLDFELQPSGAVKLALSGRFGNEIDSFNTQKGELLRLKPGVELKLARRLKLDLGHSYQRLNVLQGRLFRENLIELRGWYHFNVRTLVRVITQFRSIDRNLTLFPIPLPAQEQNLFVEFLGSYKLNPRTVFFVGYSGNALRLEHSSLFLSDRTFFVKLGYALTF